MSQLELAIAKSIVEKEIEGIEMGVLVDELSATGRGVRGFGSTGVRCDGGCAPRPCYCAELRRGDGCLAAQEAAGATIGAAEGDGCGLAEIVAPEANTTARGGS